MLAVAHWRELLALCARAACGGDLVEALVMKWRPLRDLDAVVAVECCEARPKASDVIYAVTTLEDQKRGQPPFRYRCVTCGPTQDDYPRPRAT